MDEINIDFENEMKELTDRGGEINILCPAPCGVSVTHTSIRIDRGTPITCKQHYLKIQFPNDRGISSFIVPYSSIAYISMSKEKKKA